MVMRGMKVLRMYTRAGMIICLVIAGLMLIPADVHTQPVKANVVKVNPPDLTLLDQDGKKMRFKSEIIGDRIVAITFTYTTCTTICPVLDGIFIQLQDMLGKRLGKDIRLITMSIDPTTDIPPRMKQYAKRLNAKPGWLFLTGRKPDVDTVLKALDMYSADILNHPPTVFVVDGQKGTWKRMYGFPSPEQIMAVMRDLESSRS